MEQGSNLVKEEEGMMNVEEVARMSEWLRAKGLKDADILDCVTYIATGVGLPEKKPDSEAKSE